MGKYLGCIALGAFAIIEFQLNYTDELSLTAIKGPFSFLFNVGLEKLMEGPSAVGMRPE